MTNAGSSWCLERKEGPLSSNQRPLIPQESHQHSRYRDESTECEERLKQAHYELALQTPHSLHSDSSQRQRWHLREYFKCHTKIALLPHLLTVTLFQTWLPFVFDEIVHALKLEIFLKISQKKIIQVCNDVKASDLLTEWSFLGETFLHDKWFYN